MRYSQLLRFFCFLITLTVYTTTFSATQTATDQAQSIAEYIFGRRGMGLAPSSIQKITVLYTTLLESSEQEIENALACTLQTLQKNASTQQDPLHRCATATYYTHFEKIVREKMQSKKGWQQLRGGVQQAVFGMRSFFGLSTTPEMCQANSITQAIHEYILFEQNEILNDYNRTLAYFAALKKKRPPMLVDFWNNSQTRREFLSCAIHKKADVFKVQFLGAIAESIGTRFVGVLQESLPIALQSGIMAGGSMYTAWLNQEAQAEFERLAKRQKEISDSFSEFMRNLQSDRQKKVQAIVQGFVSAQKEVAKKYETLLKGQQNEYLYLNQSISLDLPKTKYLTDQLSYDQLFAASKMATPQNAQWYNVFHQSSGDWAYDADKDSFIQRAFLPFGVPYWAPFNGQDNPNVATIFTEYIAPSLPYKISVECRLIGVTYPFFAGLLINRARWISGDPERLDRYRLIGLYGSQENSSDATSLRVDLTFAEQEIQKKSSQGQESERILSPLEIITTRPTKRLYQLPKKIVEAMRRDPTTYRFDITVEAKQVGYALFEKDETSGAYTMLTSGSVNELKSVMALFHGIGFLTVGAIASWKIIEPEALRVSQSERAAFKGA